MKKFLPVLALAVLLCQALAFSKGRTSEKYSDYVFPDHSKIAQLGIGLGLHGLYGDLVFPPTTLSFEYGIRVAPMAPLSFGGVVGFSSSKYDVNYGYGAYSWTYNYWVVAARAAYHFCDLFALKNSDLYAGIVLGYTIVTYEYTAPSGYTLGDTTGTQTVDNYLLYGAYAGIRYYFTDFFGVFAELGYGLGIATTGVTFKF